MKSDYKRCFHSILKKKKIPPKYHDTIQEVIKSYSCTLQAETLSFEEFQTTLSTYIELIQEQILHPFHFEPYHQRITQPFDYYLFGNEFIRPLILKEGSYISHMENVERICQQLRQGENVILLGNHQTEIDPQVISLLLEKTHPKLAQDMIFVAGDRVISDTLAVPLSKGRNLLCIYSKKYLNHPPSLKSQKQAYNKKTMLLMKDLLKKGCRCIYVAPSGGRDRKNTAGNIEVAPFDPKSIEMFYLMAKASQTTTHFYPLSLNTYDLLPPPDTISIEIGEKRSMACSSAQLAFGDEIPDDPSLFKGKNLNKEEKKSLRARYIWEKVKNAYHRLTTEKETT